MTELDRELPEGYKMTELGPLPEEWEVVKLGDVAEYINGYAFKPSQWKKKGLPIVRIQNLTQSTNEINYFDGIIDKKYMVKNEDILISWSASLGVFKWGGGNAWLNQHIFKVDNYSDNILKEYFYYIVMTKIDFMKTKTRGSTMHHITKKEFLAVDIPLPPLPEQRKIAAVLSTVQEAKEKTEAVISAAKSLKKSMMSYLFTYGPVPLPDAENISQKETEIGMIPEEWEVVNLSEVINLRRGVSWRKEEANREGIGIPVVGIPNIKENGSIDFSNTYFLNKNISEEKILRMNDILFVSSSGSIKNIGRNVLIREIPQNRFTYASFTFLGRVSSMKVDSEYLFYLLNSRVVDFTKYARRASDGKYNFQLTQFKNEQKIPLPPLPEQEKIASMLSAIDEKIEAEENKKKALEDLFNTLLHNLMTARIRVNHLALDKAELAM